MTRPIRLLALLLILAAAPAAAQKPNLIFITVDAMRPDHMSCYGYHRPTTPNLDRIAARGVRFTDATSGIPLTNPSMTSTFTSLPPWLAGSTRNGISMGDHETLPGILRREGWTTAAVVASWPLMRGRSGLERDFDHYEDRIMTPLYILPTMEREARWTTMRALDWLNTNPDGPFMLYLHYADPHQPHTPPPTFSPPLPRDRSLSAVVDYYDWELAYADRWIGVLLDELERRGALENSLVVVMADHGESLGDGKKFIGHGRRLYQSILRIPLILAGRGLPAGIEVSEPVEYLDVAPTVLDLLGVPAGPEMRGISVLPAIVGVALPERPFFFESYSIAVMSRALAEAMRGRTEPVILGIRRGRFKLIYTFKPGRFELYDLAADPAELTNLYKQDDPAGARLAVELADYYRLRGREFPEVFSQGAERHPEDSLESGVRSLSTDGHGFFCTRINAD